MADHGKSLPIMLGRFIFQIRSFTPLILLGLWWVPFARPMQSMHVAWALVCIGLGILIRVISVSHATAGTRTRDDQAHPLCTKGPYALVRNPLYIANILIYSAVAWLFTLHWGWTWLAGVVFFSQYTFIIRYEESLCRRLFGKSYQIYCSQVSRWIPRWDGQVWKEVWQKGQVALHQAAAQELRGMFAVGVTLIIFWLKQQGFFEI